ncbi:MAG: amidohydrolase [Eubacteriales bacterium]|jgi:amidohydrolase|nr:amidohydrolase [Eubacteriales bacterium]
MFDPEVCAIESDLIAWRRHMHQHPEVSFAEALTTLFLEGLLRSFGVDEITRPTKTGLIAHIYGEKAGKPAVVAFRADIDALPIQEENDLPYCSANAGVMHACGHDGHAAMLLALARLLCQNRESFCGEARLIFQHAEELPPGGAIELVRAGALAGAEAALGLHLSSNFDTGAFGIKSGVLTSNVDRFTVTVTGRGGHCAFPEQCADPLLAASEMVLSLQSIVSRRVPAQEPAVLSVCEFHAGTAYNIIPSEAMLNASVRSFGEETRALIEREARNICKSIAIAHGCTAQLEWHGGYPSVVNEPKLTAEAERVIAARFGEAQMQPIGVIMPGEDFSYMLNGRPGFFVELGTRNPALQTDAPHHNPRYRMDEAALLYGVQYQYDFARALLDGTRRSWEGQA